MNWILLSLTTAFFMSVNDVIKKKIVTSADPFCLAFLENFSYFIFTLPIFFAYGFPEIKEGFFLAWGGSSVLLFVACVFYFLALRYGDISNTVPMLCFTPAFLLGSSYLMLNEFPGRLGLVGILFIVFGAYMLNRINGLEVEKDRQKSLKGPLLMLAVAIIWSITANFDKMGVINSSPSFWLISIFGSLSILNFLTVVFKGKFRELLELIKRFYRPVMALGLFGAVGLICQMIAVRYTIVPYIIAIKRTSTLFCVIWGRLIFKEKETGKRFFGAAIMFVGILLIIFSSQK